MNRLLFINPNSTGSMTNAIEASAKAALPEAHIEAWTSHDGPPAIEGPADGAAAVPPLLDLCAEATGFDAIVIACFDDTGLAEAKRRAPVPVIGIGEAAFHSARLLGHRFSVVTTLSISVPVIENNIAQTGFADICGRVRASELPVLAIEQDPPGAVRRITEEAARALAEDNISAIVLGCAGMTGLTESLARLDVAIIDPITSAAHLADAIASLQKGA